MNHFSLQVNAEIVFLSAISFKKALASVAAISKVLLMSNKYTCKLLSARKTNLLHNTLVFNSIITEY